MAAVLVLWKKGWISIQSLWQACVQHVKSVSRALLVAEICFLMFFLFILIGIHNSVYVVNDSGLYCGITNNLGDLPLHISYITSFAWGDNYPPENPIFAGHPLRYPVLMDFFSAVLLKMGLPLHEVLSLPGILFSMFIAFLLYFLVLTITGKRWLAFLGPILFFFSGNTGFVQFFTDISQSASDPIGFFSNLPKNYSFGDQQNIHFFNLTVALLIPQRSFLLGSPLGISVFLLWLEGMKTLNKRVFFVAGLLVGLCPFAHMHTFICLVILSWAYGLLTRKKEWLYFYIPGFLLSIGQVLAFSASAKNSLGLQLGWMAQDENILWFWLKNLGLFLPAYLLALFIWRKDKIKFNFSIGLIGLFLVANVFRLANWDWDNIKIFAWWYIGAIPAVLFVLYRIWLTVQNRIPIKVMGRMVGALGFCICMLSMILVGVTDVARAIDYETQMEFIFSKDELEAAEEVKKLTAPQSVFLSAPTYDHFISLTGRKRLLGYPDHITSHGIPLGTRKNDVEQMLINSGNSMHLLKKYKPDYIVVSRHERALRADEDFLDRFFEPLLTEKGIKIYSTDNLKELYTQAPTDHFKTRFEMKPFEKPKSLKPGLRRLFYPNTSSRGAPRFTDTSPQMSFHANYESEKPMPAPFSFISEGWLHIAQDGNYNFILRSDDGSWLYLNDQLVIDNGGLHGIIEKNQQISMVAGYYKLKIKYFDIGGGAAFNFQILQGQERQSLDLSKMAFFEPGRSDIDKLPYRK